MRELKVRCNEFESQLSSHVRERVNAEKCSEESVNQLQAMKVELSAVHKQLQIVSSSWLHIHPPIVRKRSKRYNEPSMIS